jgi:hypothetical protein
MTLKNYFFKLIMHLVEMHTNKRVSCSKLIDIFYPLENFLLKVLVLRTDFVYKV